ncbi:reverse transcriptase domain-containing protein [Altererythrobacter sp. ZODW24]|uniref:reverse transcriptase domain-containing protein n=1 Tax=Altererythrobacter sp. ZODW24 TaxID=2185142 RepID=UPI0013B45A72|nr:reverse transcriptase domain-containing protein [Altererythrobacter sp. ZODW24]
MKQTLAKKARKFKNLEDAWRVIQRNGRYSKSDEIRHDIEAFAENATSHLRSIQHRLSRDQFEFGKAKGVPIKKLDAQGRPTGKIRPIVISPLESRIVQRAVLNVLNDVPQLQGYIKTPYSFGGLRKDAKPQSPQDLNLSAVPAAISSILSEIGNGARWVACADISAFFTKISKASVLNIVKSGLNGDTEFFELTKKAVSVELSNLTEMRNFADDFPIEDMGVAQGNSLSPLLGNITLAAFDAEMNIGDCACIRYIDDFIILGPTAKAVNARLRKAASLLNALGMDLSPEKSSKKAQEVEKGFEFLGIEIAAGLIRPAAKSRSRFLSKVTSSLRESERAILGLKHGNRITKSLSVIQTLKRIDGIVDGWGKHYWFCNDGKTFRDLDISIRKYIESYLSTYHNIKQSLKEEQKHLPLGILELGQRSKHSFQFPSLQSNDGSIDGKVTA